MRTAHPLIPRRTLFDNPTFFAPKLSPDGRWITWLAPVDGVLNVWLALADIKAGVPVTRTKGRPINWQDRTADGRFLMFLNDEIRARFYTPPGRFEAKASSLARDRGSSLATKKTAVKVTIIDDAGLVPKAAVSRCNKVRVQEPCPSLHQLIGA